MSSIEIQTKEDLDRAFEHGPYAWPGGYPCYFCMADGEAMSFKAAEDNKARLYEALKECDKSSDWLVCGFQVNWEDTNLVCAASNEKIQSAYGEEDGHEG